MSERGSERDLAEVSLPHAVALTAIQAEIDVQASQIAFNAVFALGPLMALTMTLLSALPDSSVGRRFRDMVVDAAPAAVRPFLEAQIRAVVRSPSPALVIVSFVGLLWTISASTSAVAIAQGHIGWKLLPSWAHRRFRAAVLGITLALGLGLSGIAATIGPRVLRVFAHITRIPFEPLFSYAWLRWPIAGLVFALASAMFVTFGTAQRPRPVAITWGGISSGVVSVGASGLLGFYFARASSFGAYGAAGAVFAALLWLYLLALGLLFGSTVAYVLDRRGTKITAIVHGHGRIHRHQGLDGRHPSRRDRSPGAGGDSRIGQRLPTARRMWDSRRARSRSQ